MAKHEAADAAPHLLVVIDHREAKVYHTEVRGAVPERVTPYDPHGHGRHLHSAHEETDGKRQPERKSYHEAVAKTLAGAGQILLFGSGTGRSSEMDQLAAELKAHHKDVAAKVVGTVVIDPHHTTEGRTARPRPRVLRDAEPQVGPAARRDPVRTPTHLTRSRPCRATPSNRSS